MDASVDAPTASESDPWVALAARLHASGHTRARIAGRYVLGQPLGRGGMGSVYLAHDGELDRAVAVKLLHLPPGGDMTAARRRLRHEAFALARLAHPNVVAVFDVCEHEGQLVLVLEYVEGEDLRHRLAAADRPPWRRIVGWFLEAADGLAAAHAAGLVHGDVKPANLLVGRDDRVRVADFGLATPWAGAAETITDGDAGPSSTAPGAGTPRYMAPEQRAGAHPSPWSDQYALCLSLREALDGRYPFAGADDHRVLPRPPANAVPWAVYQAIDRGLRTDPHARWPDVHALAAALRRAIAPRRRALPVLAGGLGVAAFAWAMFERPTLPCAAAEAPPPWRHHDRQAVREAVIGAGAGPDDWDRIAAELDAGAQQWTRLREQRCAAVAATAEAQQQALACVERLGHALDARVALLREADARTLAGATQSIAAITHECGEPAPRDGALARNEADTEALHAAGRYAEALELARHGIAAATKLGDGAAAGRARLRAAMALDALARYDEASTELERVVHDAEAADDQALVARAALRLVFVWAQQRGDAAAARPWLRHAEAALARVESTPGRRASLEAAAATLATAEGDFTAAQRARTHVVELLTEVHGAGHLDVATAMHNLAMLELELGNYEEARRLSTRVIEIREAALGPMHPLVGSSRSNLGPALQRLGDFEGAAEQQRLALAIAERSLGPDHPQVAAALANTAVALANTGKIAEAAALERRALQILERTPGADGNYLAVVLSNLANRQRALGELDGAEHSLRRALELLAARGTSTGPMVAAVHGNLGELFLARGDAARGAESLATAAHLFAAAVGAGHVDTLRARAGQADALALAGRGDEARAVATAALADAGPTAEPETIAALRVHATAITNAPR